ncbi:MAG: hypothetical protein ABI972_26020 [Acidobacteriota bacterium]
MRLWLSAAFFTSYLAVQLSLPVAQILRDHHAFRWGMFAYSGDRKEVFAEYADGTRESLEQIQQRTGRARLFRSEIDKERVLPPYLCALTPLPANILFRSRGTGGEKRYPCH